MKPQSTFILVALLSVLITLVESYPAPTFSAAMCKSTGPSKDCIVMPEQKASEDEEGDIWEKRSSPRRAWAPRLMRTSSNLGAGSSSSPTNQEADPEQADRAYHRSQSLEGATQIGQALVGGLVVSTAMSMDLWNRRQRGAHDLTLPNIAGSNPFGGLDPLHAIAGAAVSQVITDPRGTYHSVKHCVGAACTALSQRLLGEPSSSLHPSPPRRSPRGAPTSPKVDGVTGWTKVRKYVARKQKMENSKAKKAKAKQKSIVLSS